MAYFAYFVRCADGTFYAGSTNDLRKRLHAHNHLKSGAKYTRARRPVELVHFEKFRTKSRAMKREAELKGMKRSAKLCLIGTRARMRSV